MLQDLVLAVNEALRVHEIAERDEENHRGLNLPGLMRGTSLAESYPEALSRLISAFSFTRYWAQNRSTFSLYLVKSPFRGRRTVVFCRVKENSFCSVCGFILKKIDVKFVRILRETGA